MRITSNMILHNAATNINGNKILVDKGNNQMTTQTKIQRPSEDPVIAVRSLALQTRLSKINQYYETNIPDAEQWMDVTETAVNNIIDSITELKKLCVQGSTSTMNTDDRETVLKQLKSLQESIFAEGNADYAGRTVFTGYRTDKTLVFTDDDCDKKYNITQELSANDFEKVSYFNHEVQVPSNTDQVKNLDKSDAYLGKNDITIQNSSYKRLRLAYDNISDVESLTFSYKNSSGGTVTNTMHLVTQAKDENNKDYIPPLAATDKDGNLKYETDVVQKNNERKVKSTEGGTPTSVSYNYDKVSSASSNNDLPETVYVFENELDWADWSSKNGTTDADKLTKYVPTKAAVLIKETGDLIFGKNTADQMSAKETSVAVNYDKNSFSAGELKPEYYYDCVDNTGAKYTTNDSNKVNSGEDTLGSRLVYNRSDIAYDINYTVAVNQNITVNLQANEIFDSSAQQDMKDLTSVITNTQDAYEKREKIAALMKDSDYQDPDVQKKLSEWYTAASKEYDYYNDYMQETFERVLGNTEDYLNKANLAETTLGCRGDELKITKTRMDEQQESVTELKSKNDNLDLSTIMMNYTAYYTAYQASLVAAGKLGEQSLLNYI